MYFPRAISFASSRAFEAACGCFPVVSCACVNCTLHMPSTRKTAANANAVKAPTVPLARDVGMACPFAFLFMVDPSLCKARGLLMRVGAEWNQVCERCHIHEGNAPRTISLTAS